MVNRPLPQRPATEDELVVEAERLLRQGEPLLAYNAADTGLQHAPGHLRLRQLRALALARSGDLERANRCLLELARDGVDDAETLGVLARTHKDLGLQAQDHARREMHLDAAYRLYEQAYSNSLQRGSCDGALYTGINAATVAVLRGQLDEARWLAADVNRICTEAGDGARVRGASRDQLAQYVPVGVGRGRAARDEDIDIHAAVHRADLSEQNRYIDGGYRRVLVHVLPEGAV